MSTLPMQSPNDEANILLLLQGTVKTPCFVGQESEALASPGPATIANAGGGALLTVRTLGSSATHTQA